MQNIESGKTLKDLQKFPDKFTFKIMGDNTNKFAADVRKIFDNKEDVIFSDNVSRTGKYISISATLEVYIYDDLESLYIAIINVEGLKFHV